MDGAGVVGDVAGAGFEAGGAAETFGGRPAAHASHDPRQFGNIVEVLDLSGSVPPFGDEQVEVVGAEVDGHVSGQLAWGFVFMVEEEGDVDSTVIEQTQRFGRFSFGDFVRMVERRVSASACVGLESTERRSQWADDEAGESSKTHIASAEAEGFGEVAAQSRHRGGHLIGTDAGELAGSGESDAAWRAVEEGDAEVLFQGVHVLGQRWLGPAEFTGGGTDAAGFGDGAEDEEAFGLTDVESLFEDSCHKSSLCQSRANWVYRRQMIRTTLEVVALKSLPN